MAKLKELIAGINKIIIESANKFNSTLPNVELKISDGIKNVLKDLDLNGNTIVPSVKNLRLVSGINKKLLRVIVDKDYKANVQEYLNAFNDITKLQNQYYSALEASFKPTKLLQAIREEAINGALQGLTEAGLTSSLADIKTTLIQNITTGGNYADLMKAFSTGSTVTPGLSTSAIAKFSQQIKTTTITSVAQYSRNYSHTIAEGLNFRWYQYVGSTITTTRCFCFAMTEKRYFHRDEIPDIIAGNFKEFEKRKCELNPKTKLPDGFIAGTNTSNFMTYAGGWNCQHSIFPMPDSAVPADLRAKFG